MQYKSKKVIFILTILLFTSFAFLVHGEDKAKKKNNFRDIFKFKTDKRAKWDYIVLHHSATAAGTAKAFDRYHRKHFKDPWGLEYHFVILNGKGSGSVDGKVEIGKRWQHQVLGNHLFRPEKAKKSIAICLVGNFEKKNTLTKEQFRSTVKLIRLLMKRYKIPIESVITHYHVDGPGKKDGRPESVCPGRFFPYERIIQELKRSNKTKDDQ